MPIFAHRRATVCPVAVILSLFCLSLGLTAPAWSQSQATTGVLEGTVFDVSGAVLPGVSVSLQNTATDFERVVLTDERGRFRAVLLPLGPYRASASLEGFATAVREGLQLTLGATLNLRLKLEVSATEEQILVTAESPLIETTSPQSAVKIDRETLEGLPNNGRNFLELTKLTPGVAIVQGPDGDELTVNGQKGTQNNVMVDGADFNSPFFGEQRGGQRPSFTFNIDAVQEFVVIADGAPAEFGRASSGFISVVTKSGTNETRGTAHLFHQSDSLSTRAERADGSREPERDFDRAQLGFTLGGALRRGRLFYFTAFDYQEADDTGQRDPDRIEPRVVDALARLGAPGENLPIDRTDDNVAYLGKLDWQSGDSHLLTGRFNYTYSEQRNGTFDVDSWGVSANANEKDSSWALSGSAISNLSSTTLNELRFQYAREDRPRVYEGPTLAGSDRPLPDTAFDFDRGYRFGLPFFIPVRYHDTRWQLNDNLSWLRGAHAFKAGIEYNQTSASQTFIGFANGRFIFSSTEGFLSYLENPTYVECSDGSSSALGVCPDGADITGPVLFYLQLAGVGDLTVEEAGTQTITQDEPAVFLQDAWQPTPNLTVHYGLRWEAQIQPDPITPPSEVFYSDFIGRTSQGQVFPSDGRIPSDYDNWQPRLGVAWDPKGEGRTVVRANAGLYYARIPGLVLASALATNGSLGQNVFRSSELTPILGPPPPYTELIPASEVGSPFRPDIFVFDRDFENPRTLAAAFSVEHAVTPRLSLQYKFNWADTEELTRYIDRNDPLLGSPWQTGLGADGSNGAGILTSIESTANSLYQGHTVGLTYRSEKLDFRGFYTYSKDRSDDDNERDPFVLRYARITDLDAEWGFSDRDQRDRINAWLLWRAPLGIDVNARFSYRSPQPISITETGDIAATPQDRINADGSVTPRNLGRKDNKFSSLDVRISKTWSFTGFDLEAIVEGFNLTNSRNELNPGVSNLIFNFDGTVESGFGDPRQFQLGLRLVF